MTQRTQEKPGGPVHYVGIDPSLRSTGLAIISEYSDRTEKIAMTVKPPKRLLGVARLCWIRGEVVRILEETCTGVVRGIAIEEGSFRSTGRQLDLAELRGILKVLAVSLGVMPVGVAPSRLKKVATGSGAASKERMIKHARAMGWDVKNDDEADAAMLGEFSYGTRVKSRANS
jgi:Holliday junction resolvasome RuvABC endonuclease subunit